MKGILIAAVVGVVIGLAGCVPTSARGASDTTDAQEMATFHAGQAGADWVKLPNGDEVLCVFPMAGKGVSCDWDHVR